jgi:hypothetical protein
MALIRWLRKQWHGLRGTVPTEEQSHVHGQDERTPRAELHNMPMKSTPDAAPQPSTLPRELEKQRRTWLAQQKMEWFNRRRAVWEADGKLIPWAEWIARREYEWTANELPNRELQWAQQHAEKTEAIVA